MPKTHVRKYYVLHHIKNSEVAKTERFNADGTPATQSGLSQSETVRVTLKNGKTFDLVRDEVWNKLQARSLYSDDGVFANAEDVAKLWRRKYSIREDDLATAFVTSGINPGLQLIAQRPGLSQYEGAICLTTASEFVLWQDDTEES